MYILRELKGGRKFYTTLGSLNFGAICMGITLGWPKPFLIYFLVRKNEYDEVMYDEITADNSELQTVMNIGTCIGVLFPMYFVDLWGRKKVFGVSGAVDAISWVVLTIARGRVIFIVAAFVGGLAIGIFLTTMALYVAEISSPTNRGVVGALTMFCIYTGVLFTECMAIISLIRFLSYVMCALPIIFLICALFWMIESPHYLYQRGKVLESKTSLKAIRGMRTVLQVDEEFKAIARFFNMNEDSPSRPTLCEVFQPKHTKKSVIIILPILCISQMVGGHAMDDYAEQVIDIAVPHYGRLLLSSLNVVSVAVCLYIIETVGRRMLLMISIVGSALCCLTLGIYRIIVQENCHTLDGNLALPIAIISVYYAVYSLGLIPILPVLTGEIFPCRVKTIAVGCSMMFIYFVAVTMQTIYHFLHAKTGGCFAFVAFTLLGSIGIPLIAVSLPETKGKSLYQIQDEFEDIAVIIP